ncbi:Hypothetical predicted protein [Paramuricea clavata]|nr:Hypothetical predicted protein [Paramuricea clavata]
MLVRGMVRLCSLMLIIACFKQTSGQLYNNTSHFTSHYGTRCIDQCATRGKDYYWCNTNEGWDYCSPIPDFTCINVPCRDNQHCGQHGMGYHWCYTGVFTWDFCGVVEGGTREYLNVDTKSRIIRADRDSVCVFGNTKNNRRVIFHSTAANIVRDVSSESRSEIQRLVATFRVDLIPGRATSNFLNWSGNFRMDMQGTFTLDGRGYYNIQIQRNVIRAGRTSTTYAQVLVADDDLRNLTSRIVRRAFLMSLSNHEKVRIAVGERFRRRRSEQKDIPPCSASPVFKFMGSIVIKFCLASIVIPLILLL